MAKFTYFTTRELQDHGEEKTILALLQILTKHCPDIRNVRRVIPIRRKGRVVDHIYWVRGYNIDHAIETVAARRKVTNASENIDKYLEILYTIKEELNNAREKSESNS